MNIRRIGRKFIALVNFALGQIESLLLLSIPNKPITTVWIIGPPRSGTTLLYQILVKHYKFAYLSNFSAMFFRAPILSSWAARSIFHQQEKGIKFVSNYGRTDGWLGPSESGEFWYRWFPRGEHIYVPPHATSAQTLEIMRREITGISIMTRKPVIFKNTYNSMRIAPIVEAFPNAKFLVCQRDPVDISQSILNGRVKALGDKSPWWSLPPKEIDAIKQHAYWEQVVEQVYYVYKQIEEDKQRYGEEHFHNVNYHELCQHPRQTLSEIEQFLNIKSCNCEQLPEQFPLSTGRKVSEDDYQKIQSMVRQLWG